jgi:hypothetical protein
MASNIKIIKDKENPETPELLAQSIVKIASAFELLMSGPISQRAVVVLLKDMPGMGSVGINEINLVLNNLKRLKSYWIK